MARSSSETTWFRHVLGEYPTGVSVATALDRLGRPVGMTIGSFTSVSLEPQLIAFMANRDSSTWCEIRATEAFCINVLSAQQANLGQMFASQESRFRDAKWRAAGSGSPILEDIVAWIDCDLDAVHDAGDHHIAVGRVRDLCIETSSEPLMFHRGGYGHFLATTPPTA